MTDQMPVVELTISQPKTLADVQKWSDLADALGIPTTSPVSLSVGGTSLVIEFTSLSVRAFLARVPPPVGVE